MTIFLNFHTQNFISCTFCFYWYKHFQESSQPPKNWIVDQERATLLERSGEADACGIFGFCFVKRWVVGASLARFSFGSSFGIRRVRVRVLTGIWIWKWICIRILIWVTAGNGIPRLSTSCSCGCSFVFGDRHRRFTFLRLWGSHVCVWFRWEVHGGGARHQFSIKCSNGYTTPHFVLGWALSVLVLDLDCFFLHLLLQAPPKFENILNVFFIKLRFHL